MTGRPRRGRVAAAVALAAALAVGLAACSDDVSGLGPLPVRDEAASTPGPEPREVEEYAALGDSFTAAPFVPTTDLADGCLRSDGNYPSLLAERLDVADFTDVSCSGAATSHLSRPQETVPDHRVPPQLDAVDADTDLVTLGIGGNDFGLFGTLTTTCPGLRRSDPQGSPCFDDLERRDLDLVALTDRIGDRVEQAVRELQEAAPDATVVLVGYPRLAPDTGTCPRRLPFADGDYREADRVTRSLNEALEEAAERTGVLFADMYAAAEGHDVCSDDPWVNGRQTRRDAALAYHPYPAGMEAVADEVARLLP